MEWDLVWYMIGVMVGCSFFVYGVIRNLNEIFTFAKLGNKGYKALPPGHLSWPIFGSSISFYRAFTGGHPHSFLHHIISKNGDGGMYRTHLFGKPTAIITEREASRRILGNDAEFPQFFPKSSEKLSQRAVTMLIEHKALQRMNSCVMSGSEALSSNLEHIEESVKNALEECASMRAPFELLTEMKALTLRLICRIILGSGYEPYLGQLENLYHHFSAGVLSLLPYDFPGSTFRRAVQAREKLIKLFIVFMEERRRRSNDFEEKENKCLLELVTEAKKENGEKLLENEAIIDFLLLLMFAGEETSAITATWAMIYLTQHPQILQKAKEEQEKIINKRPSSQKGLTFHETKEMKYLTNIIKETLRMISPLFSSIRRVKVEANFNGYTIPKGWNVAVWNRYIHYNPQIYPNPEKFDPSRWDSFVPKPGTFLPFGFGNRYCCGSELAMLELQVLLHHFVLYYKLEVLNPKCKITYLPNQQPIDNCLSKLTKIV